VILFFLTFLLFYGGLHVFFFLRIRAAFAPGVSVHVVLIALLIIGLMAPLIIRALERLELETLARLMSWGGYLWMAILFLFFSVSLLLDLYRLLVYTAGLVLHADVAAYLPTARTLFLIPIAAALGIGGYGFFEARQIRPEYLEIHSDKIPKSLGKIRIVQISDVHVGVLVREKRLAAILRRVSEAQPDLLVSTGDLVDGQLNSMAEAMAQFRELRPRYGKFAVTGNHEFYAGIDEAIDFITQSGFTLLRGEAATVAGVVDLAGVDDPTTRHAGPRGGLSDREILSRKGGDRFTILLKHQPVVEKDAPDAFDLQLSGHTHRGQIFPFSLITSRFFPLHSGDYHLTEGALLHVSRGTGTWGPPIRFLSPPEITIIDLIPR
jgi:predicted MPP superfamily phosphohydrolase